MYFKLRHIGGAQIALEKLNFVADLFDDFKALLSGKELLGKCLRELKRHEESLDCFKFQLQLSWITKSKLSEARAYDNIGL